MKRRALEFFLLNAAIFGFWFNESFAYVPPAFHIYNRLAQRNETLKQVPAAISMKVVQHSISGAEVPVGTVQVSLPSEYHSGWPTLTLLTLRSPEILASVVTKLGLAVLPEATLVAPKPAGASKHPVRKFYHQDDTMSMRRLRNTIAFVHSLPGDLNKSIWFEKESISVLKISNECPQTLAAIPGTKPGSPKCDLEFRNMLGFHQGRISQGKFTLLRDGQPLVSFLMEKTIPQKTTTEPTIQRVSTIDLPESYVQLIRELFN